VHILYNINICLSSGFLFLIATRTYSTHTNTQAREAYLNAKLAEAWLALGEPWARMDMTGMAITSELGKFIVK